MGVELVASPEDGTIHPKELKIGELGVVTKWSIDKTHYVGIIVMLVPNDPETLYQLGGCAGSVWSGVSKLGSRCRVRVLEQGEMIRIT